MTSPDFDPVMTLKESAHYLGFRGSDPVKSLRRLGLERTRIPGTGKVRAKYGHRLSVLNNYLAALQDPRSRVHTRARKAS